MRRALCAIALAGVTAGAAVAIAADTAPVSASPGGLPGGAALVVPAGEPSPAQLVRETGSWFAHAMTLELRDDGTGEFAVWMGAYDGDRVHVRLIPAPGPATVAEVTGVETVGLGALGPHSRPGVGGLITVGFGSPVRTAHVEWTSGADRHSADLCPAEGLDAAAMEQLRCGA